MLVESEKIEKICSFYVSDFHLEMILVPYINKKLEEKEEITIMTEKNLKETVEILMSKMNLSEENKQKILNLGWNKGENVDIKEKSNIIIIGSEKYIQETNNKIKNSGINNISVVDCYNFEEVNNNINNIINQHNKSLNTLGFNKF